MGLPRPLSGCIMTLGTPLMILEVAGTNGPGVLALGTKGGGARWKVCLEPEASGMVPLLLSSIVLAYS